MDANAYPLHIDSLSVTYGAKLVIGEFSRSFDNGCYAVLGGNGRGKTSFLKALAGILPVDNRCIYIKGVDLSSNPKRAKAMLSFMPDRPYVYPFMTGRDLLKLIAWAKRVSPYTSDIEHIVERLNLKKFLDLEFHHMSFGTQRKVTLVGALIGSPSVLLMDEPLNGLDHCSQEYLVDFINKNKESKVILLTSHNNDLLERISAENVNLDECV
jgi:heme-transporting ATPase